MTGDFRLPATVWAAAFWRTAKHILIAVVASVILSTLMLEIFSQGLGHIGLIAAIVAPIMLGGPLVFYLSLKQQELQLAYERLETAAARDSLTNCLNHGAFVAAVNAAMAENTNQVFALLVVDADHFKSINDRFGHTCGDTALKLLVSAIRTSTEDRDIIGRLGGEEFGVFLINSDVDRARSTAEAIRAAVRDIDFDIGPEKCDLSVSIGGAVTRNALEFGELFRHADQRLYKVKESGRNNFDIVLLPPRPANTSIPLPTPAPRRRTA